MCTNIECTCSTIIQSLNLKEWKLLELHITQTRSHLSISNEKCLSSRLPQKKNKNIPEMCIHLQCVKNHYGKFEYKGMITRGVSDYTNYAPPKHFGKKQCLCSPPVKNILKK